MNIAITHDYLIDFGGAERVLLALHEMYPKAPIYVSVLNKKGMGSHWENFKNADIKTSWFNSLPFASKLISPLRFLLPLIWRSFDLSNYDLIIDSSSWAITRGFKTKNDQKEICYCHTPPRYLYGYDTSRRWKNKWYGSFVSLYATIVNHFMRMYDFDTAQKVDYFIANSKNVAERIKKFYRRDATVIYPPVDLPKTSPQSQVPSAYYLTGGRLVAAKNFDLIIKACHKAKVDLKIFGFGILENELKSIAGDGVEFLGKVSDRDLTKYYQGAKAFIAAQKDEDFGMTLVEAQGAGCPVIAYRGGGYLESLIEGKTGVFFDKLEDDELAKTIKRFEKMKLNRKDCINQAKKFSKERFKKEMGKFIEKYA
jgi:glycosyltransferase involved in cell wall biosynthesis